MPPTTSPACRKRNPICRMANGDRGSDAIQPQRPDYDGAHWGHESARPSCRAGVQSRSQRCRWRSGRDLRNEGFEKAKGRPTRDSSCSIASLVSRILLQVGPSRKLFACFEWPKNNIHGGEILRRHEQAGWRPRSPEGFRERGRRGNVVSGKRPGRRRVRIRGSGVNRCVPATSTVCVAGAAAGISGNTSRSMAITASRFSSNMCQRAFDSAFSNRPTPRFGVFAPLKRPLGAPK
jgi:hypothetical protein